MQNDNSKNQINQFPYQVVAEENLTFPFNTELPSRLSKERISQLNYLSYDAELRYGARDKERVDEGSLMIECFGLIEALEMATDFDSGKDFHNNIWRAFSNLIKECPNDRASIFSTYSDLTSLFRVLLKQKEYLDAKLKECNAIVSDFNILDEESVEQVRGGMSNEK